MQGVVERSQKNSDLLKGYNNTIIHVVELEKELN
jgi:hypothetical protein